MCLPPVRCILCSVSYDHRDVRTASTPLLRSAHHTVYVPSYTDISQIEKGIDASFNSRVYVFQTPPSSFGAGFHRRNGNSVLQFIGSWIQSNNSPFGIGRKTFIWLRVLSGESVVFGESVFL